MIKFTCTDEMYWTLGRGIPGGLRDFVRLADLLCEDLGFVYAGVIKDGLVSLSLEIVPQKGASKTAIVGAVEPDWESFIEPKAGSKQTDLGGGPVDIYYSFGFIREKEERREFDNNTTKKYYKHNMSSSGVEIRINGRMLCYNLFKEIWGKEKHNSYNSLLVTLDIKSDNKEALPKTRTSKSAFREGDKKLEALYSWILSYMKDPPKDISKADHEIDLFEELKNRLEKYNKDPSKYYETEKHVFTRSDNMKDHQRIDLYENTNGEINIYEGKVDETTSKDVYQLRMYWDGLIYDGVTPTKGYLVSKHHPESVKRLLEIVNTMKDANGNNYRFDITTWEEQGLDEVK